MSLKKQDLARQMALKIESKMKGPAVPGRFGQQAGELVDRKEQRRRDAAAGLVPFACKLPAELTEQLRLRAQQHAGGINGLVAELLQRALA
jgi:hypothetical protein